MFRITSQLCEVFDCNKLQLEASGILNIFNEWLKLHPEFFLKIASVNGVIVCNLVVE